MAEVQLEDVLKLLVRQPLSQTALAQRLNLSKSHVSFLVKNLLDQGYLEREESLSAKEEGGGTRRRQRLKVLSHGLYTAVLIHTLWEFSLSLYPLGSSFPSVTLNLERSRYAEVMAVGGAILGYVLALSGYDPDTATNATEDQLFTFVLLFSYLPAIVMVAAGILFKFYRLEADVCEGFKTATPAKAQA